MLQHFLEVGGQTWVCIEPSISLSPSLVVTMTVILPNIKQIFANDLSSFWFEPVSILEASLCEPSKVLCFILTCFWEVFPRCLPFTIVRSVFIHLILAYDIERFSRSASTVNHKLQKSTEIASNMVEILNLECLDRQASRCYGRLRLVLFKVLLVIIFQRLFQLCMGLGRQRNHTIIFFLSTTLWCLHWFELDSSYCLLELNCFLCIPSCDIPFIDLILSDLWHFFQRSIGMCARSLYSFSWLLSWFTPKYVMLHQPIVHVSISDLIWIKIFLFYICYPMINKAHCSCDVVSRLILTRIKEEY